MLLVCMYVLLLQDEAGQQVFIPEQRYFEYSEGSLNGQLPSEVYAQQQSTNERARRTYTILVMVLARNMFGDYQGEVRQCSYAAQRM